MSDTDTLPLLLEFYRDKLSSLLSHQAGARLVTQYDANNTYQYVVNREETQVSWLAAAIADLGGVLPPDPAEPARGGGAQAIFQEDARAAAAFVERWKPRVEAMRHARHRRMLGVILGETLEQQRFFEQALAGRNDLLGVRTEKAGARVGTVLPSRWLE
ncbi:MAG: hypothetical protein AB7O32_11665 [Vicinamibacterales bacterium]